VENSLPEFSPRTLREGGPLASLPSLWLSSLLKLNLNKIFVRLLYLFKFNFNPSTLNSEGKEGKGEDSVVRVRYGTDGKGKDSEGMR